MTRPSKTARAVVEAMSMPLHEASRLGLVRLAKVLLKSISRDLDPQARWILRHSASQKGQFNLFLSDIDFSLVFASANEEMLEVFKARYFRLKRKLPWLGELEIYSAAEYGQFEELMRSWEAPYQELRLFRKRNWMNLALVKAAVPLNQLKYERALDKIACKLGRGDRLAEVLAKAIGLRPLPVEACERPFFSTYLGCWINARHDTAPYSSYDLDPAVVLFYHACLPPKRFEIPDLQEKIDQIRLDPAVRRCWLALSQIEALIVKAVNRGTRNPSPEMKEWERSLQEPALENEF